MHHYQYFTFCLTCTWAEQVTETITYLLNNLKNSVTTAHDHIWQSLGDIANLRRNYIPYLTAGDPTYNVLCQLVHVLETNQALTSNIVLATLCYKQLHTNCFKNVYCNPYTSLKPPTNMPVINTSKSRNVPRVAE